MFIFTNTNLGSGLGRLGMTYPGSLVYDVIDKLSKQPGTIQEYEDLYIMLRNLSRDELGEAVSEHNLLDIFNYIDLSNG